MLIVVVASLFAVWRIKPAPDRSGRPAGAWLAARQDAPVWGDITSTRTIPRPSAPFDWAADELDQEQAS